MNENTEIFIKGTLYAHGIVVASALALRMIMELLS